MQETESLVSKFCVSV